MYYDEEGFFFVVDRIKSLIKVNGLQVSPLELVSPGLQGESERVFVICDGHGGS